MVHGQLLKLSSFVPFTSQTPWLVLLRGRKGKDGAVSGQWVVCHGCHVCWVSRAASRSSGVPVPVRVVVVALVGPRKSQSHGRQSCQRAGSADGGHGFHVLWPDSSKCSQCSQCREVRCRARSTVNIAGPLVCNNTGQLLRKKDSIRTTAR